MTSIYRPKITDEFHTNAALALYEQLGINDNTYYLSIGKTDMWSAAEDNDLFRPPFPVDDEQGKAEFWNDIIGYLKINQSSVRPVMDRRDWGNPDRSDSRTYKVGEYTVVNSLEGINTYIDANDGYMVYKCVQQPETGVCDLTGQYTQQDCEDNGGTWTPSEGTDYPTGIGSGIDTGDGYIWDYMYTCPPDEISKFVTPEYIVVPTPSELAADPAKWGREHINTTVFDVGRIIFEMGIDKLMFYVLLSDNDFRDMIENDEAFRQIGLILNPYAYELAPDCADLDSDPLYFSPTGNGGCSVDGWKIIANKADESSYDTSEILRETGELLYMENRAPVTRSFNQLEEIRIILTF